MYFFKLLVTTTCILSAHASRGDPGPQTLIHSNPVPAIAANNPQYVLKDAILYLTPSQIKVLEASKGFNKVVPVGNNNNKQELQKVHYSNEELLSLEHLIENQLARQNIHQSQSKKPVQLSKIATPIVEPGTEAPIAFSPSYEQRLTPQPPPQLLVQPVSLPAPKFRPNYFIPPAQKQHLELPDNYSYLKFFTDKKIQEEPKFQVFQPFPHDQKLHEISLKQNLEIHDNPILQKKYKLVPYEYITETPKLEEQKWANLELLKTVQPQNSELFAEKQAKNLGIQNVNLPKYLPILKYAPQFEDHKLAAEYQKKLVQIEKENALAKAEAIRKSAPVVIQQEVTLKKIQPNSAVKPVVPAPQKFFETENKSFVVPLEIHRPIPFSVGKQEKTEFEKLQPYDVEKQIQLPETKHVFVNVDKPYLVERYLPVEVKKEVPVEALGAASVAAPVEIPLHNSEQLTITRHVWKH